MPNPIWTDSGQSPERRREEAFDLLSRIKSTAGSLDMISQKECDCIDDLDDKRRKYGDRVEVSPKQLYWLRDIYSRL